MKFKVNKIIKITNRKKKMKEKKRKKLGGHPPCSLN